MAGTPLEPRPPDRVDRLRDDRDAASICLLVCWCMEREYVAISTGGGGETGMNDSVADIFSRSWKRYVLEKEVLLMFLVQRGDEMIQ